MTRWFCSGAMLLLLVGTGCSRDDDPNHDPSQRVDMAMEDAGRDDLTPTPDLALPDASADLSLSDASPDLSTPDADMDPGCTPGTSGCVCMEGRCDGLFCVQDRCVVIESCEELGCGAHRLCALPDDTRADACLDQCEEGYLFDVATTSCIIAPMVVEACPASRKMCDPSGMHCTCLRSVSSYAPSADHAIRSSAGAVSHAVRGAVRAPLGGQMQSADTTHTIRVE